MSKRRRRNLTKAAARPAVAPAATFTAEQVQALLQSRTGQLAAPLPRTDPQVPFGPGLPLQPSLIDPPRDDNSGRSEPRIYEYPVSINLPGMTDRLVPWKVLRDAAEIPVVRDCIRIRKNEVTTLDWDIVVSKRALQTYKKQSPDTSSVQIKKELRKKLDPDVGRLIAFWEKPDWQQGEGFVEWCTKVLEEHLVLDAVAIYPFRNRGGDRVGFRSLDGSTVKPLLDHRGGRPMPPNPAYQQVLWGFPRGEFIAEVDDDGQVISGYDADRLIYRRREVRTFTPYGFSAVEMALQDVDLYLRRLEWNKAQWTDGVQPSGWIRNSGVESWSPQQLADYNRAFNDLFSGKTLERMRYHLLPPGFDPMEASDVAEKFKPDYDLHLIKLVAMHFDVTMAELGFTEAKGLGSSGYHEGQENVQQRKATNPTLKWLQGILTEISRTHLGMPAELEFKFLGLDDEDEAAADAVIEAQLKDGRITWNEAREELGRAPYAFDEADMPVVQTARGIIFVEGASLSATPGVTIGPAQAPPDAPPSEQSAEGDQTQQGDEQHDQQAPPSDQPTPPVKGDAAKTEIAAYWKWARNGHSAGRRPFVFKHASPHQVMLHEIPLDTVKFEAGEGDLKAPTAWPGWEIDLDIAAYWAEQLRAALTAAPTRAVAQRWLALRKSADPEQDDRRRDALAWLTAIGFTLTPRIRQVLGGLYADAYYVGDRSAQVLLGQIERTGWGDWKPGDTTVAERAVADAGVSANLQDLLRQAQQIADGINHTRMQRLADTLGDAVGGDATVDSLDEQLQAVLDDEAAADLVGLTETSRAVNVAAVDRYAIAPGVSQYEWATSPGNVCVQCQENADASPLIIGERFPNGVAPPLHTNCRCALLPVLS